MKSLLLTCLLFFLAAQASDAAPLLAETDEAKFIRLTSQLEQDPLADPDKSIRTWLLDRATESQDITVTVCDILSPITSQDVPHGPELLTQYLFGNAAFQIAHSTQRNDTVATQLAGVRSAMRAYSSIIAEYPQAHIPYFDTLLAKERGGALEVFLTPVIVEKCSNDSGA